MVKVFIVPDYSPEPFYADLTGRWYINPKGFLFLEVVVVHKLWPLKRVTYNFWREDQIREIQGELCV
jgi:hypothetical protein